MYPIPSTEIRLYRPSGSKNGAVNYYQQFKWDVIANFSSEQDFELPDELIDEWLKAQQGKANA